MFKAATNAGASAHDAWEAAVKEFVGELIRRKIITSVDDKMERSLFWNERSQINKKDSN